MHREEPLGDLRRNRFQIVLLPKILQRQPDRIGWMVSLDKNTEASGLDVLALLHLDADDLALLLQDKVKLRGAADFTPK